MNTQVIQIRRDMPNQIGVINGYDFKTGYWENIIDTANILILASAVGGDTYKQLIERAEELFKSEFSGEHTAVEWAEFVMSINHMLWFLNDVCESHGIEYLDPVLKALSELYYAWHNKALTTLKGDALSEYLTITD